MARRELVVQLQNLDLHIGNNVLKILVTSQYVLESRKVKGRKVGEIARCTVAV